MTWPTRARWRTLTAAALAGGLLLGCDSPTGPGGPGAPARLDVVSGDLQTGVVAGELAQPLVVKVLDEDGDPVAGQLVNFRVLAGGGSVFAGAAQTNAQGEARERWTLGTVAGDTQRVEVRAVDTTTGAALVFGAFRAVGTAAAPASVTPVGAAARTGMAGAVVPESLVVVVKDTYGNPVPRTPVVWTVRSGGGALAPALDSTSAAGVARTRWTLGPRLDSAQVAEAAAGVGLSTRFTATATVPALLTLVKVSGDAQTGTSGGALAQPVVAEVRLADGRPVAGAQVTWSGAGTATPATSASNAAGQVSAVWTLGANVGTQVLTARVSGGPSVAFTATATPQLPAPGRAYRLVRVSGDGQTATAGAPLPAPLVVKLVDVNGTPVANDSVYFERGGTSTLVLTAADGTAGWAPVAGSDVSTYRVIRPRADSTWFASSTEAGIGATVAASVPGKVIDARHGRVLYETPAGNIRVRTLASGADEEVALAAARAWITPSGVVYDAGGSLFARVGSVATAFGGATDVQVAGDYVLSAGGGTLTVRNVGTGATSSLALPAGYSRDRVALEPTGELYFSEGGALKHFSGGVVQTAVNDGSDRRSLVADGIGVAYVRTLATPDSLHLAYWSGTAETSHPRKYATPPALPAGFDYSTVSSYWGSPYVARSGWVAWANLSSQGIDLFYSVRRRNLGGPLLATSYGSDTQPVDIGPDGAVINADGLHDLVELVTATGRARLPIPRATAVGTRKVRRPAIFEVSGRALYIVDTRVIQLDY